MNESIQQEPIQEVSEVSNAEIIETENIINEINSKKIEELSEEDKQKIEAIKENYQSMIIEEEKKAEVLENNIAKAKPSPKELKKEEEKTTEQESKVASGGGGWGFLSKIGNFFKVFFGVATGVTAKTIDTVGNTADTMGKILDIDHEKNKKTN